MSKADTNSFVKKSILFITHPTVYEVMEYTHRYKTFEN